ncbi:hypothetical protein CLM62_12640 [Streptomyces sp. SA15]|uniref:DUF6085 family protein n=1 Tax=Streptomyces sp. SA15 TaxID=934019 RepID=UPI000BAF1713|nr:DUF6085 family protein [Streptomyces sp. SA15]PAZ15637.1 hypothetical protein CLM62_12640 [Streptomyces sp. SA15]
MTAPPTTARKDAALRDLHAALTRIRNLDRVPPQADPDSDTGRAYAQGWQAALAAVDTALLDVPTCPQEAPDGPRSGPQVPNRHPAAPEGRNGAQTHAQRFGDVQGRCPACGGSSLFLAEGGYITCARLDCPNPDVASQLLERQPLATGEWLRTGTRDLAIPAHDTGPTVRECAADDRRWPLQKEGS